jgi:hypothetical protein
MELALSCSATAVTASSKREAMTADGEPYP